MLKIFKKKFHTKKLNKNYKTIILCSSFFSVQKVISVAKKRGKRVAIITFNYDLYFFLKKYKKFLFIENDIFLFNSFGSRKNYIIFLIKIFYVKFILANSFKDICGANVYFFNSSYGYEIIWLAQFLSKNNNICFSPDAKFNNKKKDYAKLVTFFFRLIYGIKNLKIFRYNQIYRTFVDTKFLKSINAKKEIIPYDYNCSLNLGVKKKKILILINMHEVKEKKRQDYQNFFEHFIKKNAKQVDLKVHPNSQNLLTNNFLKNFKKINPKIPASLIINNYKIIIGCSTAVLFQSTAYKNKTIISLVKVFNEKNSNSIKKYLLSNSFNKSKIIFFKKNQIKNFISENL